MCTQILRLGCTDGDFLSQMTDFVLTDVQSPHFKEFVMDRQTFFPLLQFLEKNLVTVQ